MADGSPPRTPNYRPAAVTAPGYGDGQEMELPLVNGGKSPRPYRGAELAGREFDGQALAG